MHYTTSAKSDCPHVITADMAVKTGATLTLEPCAVVQIMGAYGSLLDVLEGRDTGAAVRRGRGSLAGVSQAVPPRDTCDPGAVRGLRDRPSFSPFQRRPAVC